MVVRKTPLEKLTEDRQLDKKGYHYTTTIEDCQKWFRILNKEVFKNKLPQVGEIDIRWRRKALAWYVPQKNGRLEMDKRYRSKRFFVQVLAHELIHHYQYMNGHTVAHNEEFFKWRKKFNKKGLKLSRCYDEETD